MHITLQYCQSHLKPIERGAIIQVDGKSPDQWIKSSSTNQLLIKVDQMLEKIQLCTNPTITYAGVNVREIIMVIFGIFLIYAAIVIFAILLSM